MTNKKTNPKFLAIVRLFITVFISMSLIYCICKYIYPNAPLIGIFLNLAILCTTYTEINRINKNLS